MNRLQALHVIQPRPEALMLDSDHTPRKRRHLIRWINYWYGALAVWNLYTTLRVLNP